MHFRFLCKHIYNLNNKRYTILPVKHTRMDTNEMIHSHTDQFAMIEDDFSIALGRDLGCSGLKLSRES